MKIQVIEAAFYSVRRSSEESIVYYVSEINPIRWSNVWSERLVFGPSQALELNNSLDGSFLKLEFEGRVVCDPNKIVEYH